MDTVAAVALQESALEWSVDDRQLLEYTLQMFWPHKMYIYIYMLLSE